MRDRKDYRRKYYANHKTRIREMGRKYYLKNRTSILAGQKEYAIRNAGRIKKNKAARWIRDRAELLAKKKIYYKMNKSKVAQSIIAYRAKNKERVRKMNADWYARNRESILAKNKIKRGLPEVIKRDKELRVKKRAKQCLYQQRRIARKYGNSTEDQIKGAELKMAEMRSGEFSACCYCGKRMLSKNITVDHVLALSRGGHHSADNLSLACNSCNCSKGNRILNLEWVPPKLRKVKSVWWPSNQGHDALPLDLEATQPILYSSGAPGRPKNPASAPPTGS